MSACIHGQTSDCHQCRVELMDDFTRIRKALFQMQEAAKGLAEELKKSEAERDVALRKLSALNGFDCAIDMAAGDAPCGVCVICLKKELDEARALLREANNWIGRDCTNVREQIAELTPLCNRIDAALKGL